jgi:succinate dehydrogenase/fumarate reductase flavoprotein subunit
MDAVKDRDMIHCSRRDFLKVAGLGVAAFSLPGFGLVSNTGALSEAGMNQEILKTDVLIIGGGIAGVFAALKARERGVHVTLVDKGTVGKSGLSPWFGAYQVFDESLGATKEQYVDTVSKAGEFLVNRDYAVMFTEDSKARYEDLVSWGAANRDTSGGRGITFRERVKQEGIHLIERTMVTELLQRDGQVAGAIGFPMEEDKAIGIEAKAVVLCSGSGAFKTPGFPASSLTHDGDAMAYRIGAEISGKEFIDFHWTHWDDPADAWSNWQREWGGFHKILFNPLRGHRGPPPVGHAIQAHSGSVPVFMRPPPDGRPPGPPPGVPRPGKEGFAPPGCRSTKLPIVGGATAGMAPHKCEGILPKDGKCSSSIPGLFAAGDALCTAGATYSGGGGYSSSASAVQGGRAGHYAAEYAEGNHGIKLSNTEITKAAKNIFEPRRLNHGYSPRWVTMVLQGIMVPYYVLYVKKNDRLEAALTNIAFIRDHFQTKLVARNTHELRLVHETRNMLLNAEMKLRASLFRTESRGAHYREDFPEKDDRNWLAWVVISQKGENMHLDKRPVPDEWIPKDIL